jgi:hypothetical protein
MLFPDLLVKGAQRAHAHKLSVSISTNGFWGAWPIEKITAFFQQAQPHSIGLSADSFHSPFINDQTLGRAAAFLYAMGINASFSTSQMKLGVSCADHYASMGNYKYLFPHYFYNEKRFGRAEQFRAEDFYEERFSVKAICLHDCVYNVFYNGFVYPCCKFEGMYSMLVLGDLRTNTLDALVHNPVMALVHLLETIGFSSLLDAAKKITPGLPVDIFSHCCTICHLIFKDISFVRKYAPLIQDACMKTAVRQFLELADARGILHSGQWTRDSPSAGLRQPHKTLAVTQTM